MRRNFHKLIITFLSVSVLLTGCSFTKQNANPVIVQSVATLAGLTDVIQQQHFVGVVSTGKEEGINKDDGRKVKTVNVKVGDIVKQGDILFVYDEQDMQDKLDTEKLQIEIDKANLESERKTLENLEKNQQKASADKQLEYALSIREQELSIQEKEYNLQKKEKEIKSMEDSIGDVNVKAPFSGRITKAGKPDSATGGDDEEEASAGLSTTDESDSSFIKIVEIDNYRIKGTINEQNRGDIVEGDIMKIYPRTNEDKTWTGEVTEVNYKETQKTNDMYGEETGDNSSSRYTFYVSLDDLDGLIIGQHVYMRVDDGTEPDGKIRLSSTFLNDMDSSPWVWAEDDNGKLEKRNVTIGEKDSEKDTIVIESGLSELDYIAAPGEYEEGMPCTENANTQTSDAENMEGDYIPEDGGDFGMDEGEYGMDDMGDMGDMGDIGDEEYTEYDDEFAEEEFVDGDFAEEEFADGEFVDDDFGGEAVG